VASGFDLAATDTEVRRRSTTRREEWLAFASRAPSDRFKSPGFTQFAIDDLTLNTSPVPEPTSMILLGTGLASLAVPRYRRRQS
jgi:PEP-CTERM motif